MVPLYHIFSVDIEVHKIAWYNYVTYLFSVINVVNLYCLMFKVLTKMMAPKQKMKQGKVVPVVSYHEF